MDLLASRETSSTYLACARRGTTSQEYNAFEKNGSLSPVTPKSWSASHALAATAPLSPNNFQSTASRYHRPPYNSPIGHKRNTHGSHLSGRSRTWVYPSIIKEDARKCQSTTPQSQMAVHCKCKLIVHYYNSCSRNTKIPSEGLHPIDKTPPFSYLDTCKACKLWTQAFRNTTGLRFKTRWAHRKRYLRWAVLNIQPPSALASNNPHQEQLDARFVVLIEKEYTDIVTGRMQAFH